MDFKTGNMAFKTEKFVSGCNTACFGAPNEIFNNPNFRKMLNPAQVDVISKQHPEVFCAVFKRAFLFMGLSVQTPDKALGDSIDSCGTLTVSGVLGKFTMQNAEKILTIEELQKYNLLLVINPFCCVKTPDGVSISSKFADKDVRHFIGAYDMPSIDKKDFRGLITYYHGKFADISGLYHYSRGGNPLDLEFVSNFGALVRSVHSFSEPANYMLIGSRFSYDTGGLEPDPSIVLLPTPTSREIIAAAKKELGGKVGPATQAAFDALLEKDKATD